VVVLQNISALLSFTNQRVMKLELGVPINVCTKKMQLRGQLRSGVSWEI